MANLIGTLSAIFLIFIFYASGTGLRSVFNLKTKNPFSAIIVGFFAFFAFLTVLLLPFQLFDLSIKSNAYLTIGFSFIYVAFTLIFVRTWINTIPFSMKLVQYVVAIMVLIPVIYFGQSLFVHDDGNILNVAGNVIKKFEDNINAMNHGVKIKHLADEYQTSFWSLQYGICVMFAKMKIATFIRIFWLLISVAILSSLYIEMFSLFCLQKKQKVRWIVFACSLVIFSGLMFGFFYFNLSIYNSDFYFVILIIYTCLRVVKLAGNKYLEQNAGYLIGLMLGSYMAFSVANTYPILFLLYAFIFTTQLRLKTGYFRTIAQMSILVLIEFTVYNIASKLWIQTGIFLGIILILGIISIRTKRRYFFESKIEIYLSQRNILAILLLPVVLFVFSSAYSLAKNTNFFSFNMEYLKIIFWWFDGVQNTTIKNWMVFVVAMAILGMSLAWVLIRQRLKKNFVYTAIDLLFILYLTFYNPFVTRTIQFVAPTLNESSGYSLMGILAAILLLIPFEVSNFIWREEIKKTHLIIYVQPSRIRI